MIAAGLVADGDASHRAVALRHAALHDRPGLWFDHPTSPSCLVWLRPGDGRLEAFAAGRPEAAVPWLSAHADGRPIALAAPSGWESALPGRVGRATVRTGRLDPDQPRPVVPCSARRLTRDDAPAFAAGSPGWAARAWGDVPTLIDRGAAFGIRHGAGFAALAWIFEQDQWFAKVGVATVERFRRLGLGRAVASALIGAIVSGGRIPLWTTSAENQASAALARSLGFASFRDEPLLEWEPTTCLAI